MDSDKNKLNKLFSESDPGLPPELNWEQMEEGIMEKMEELEPATLPSGSNNDRFFKIIVLLLLCLIPFCFFDNGLKTKSAGDSSGTQKNQAEERGQIVAEESDIQTLSLPTPPVDIPERASSSTEPQEQEIAQANSPLTNKRQGDDATANTTLPAKPAKPVQTTAAPAEPSGTSGLVVDQPAAPPANADLTAAPAPESVDTEQPLPQQGLLAQLPSLAIRGLATKGTTNMNFQPAEVATAAKRNNLTPARQLTFTSGVSNWNPGYTAAEPENAPFEESALSYYAQLSYTHCFGNNFTITAGLQYQQLQSQLEWSQRIEDYATVILQDTIVEVQVNSLTGNSTNIRGDAEVSVDATRTVRHHNQYRLFQVPLAIGKSWQIGEKWQAGLSIGGALNLLTQNKGRSVYQGELEYMDGATTNLIDNRWGIHGLGRANIGYRINARWGVMAEAQFQKSLTDWSKVSGVGMQPEVGSIGVGVYYSLWKL